MPPEYSVVLPAYLEEENLRILLPRIRRALAPYGERAEVLVVDTMEPKDHTEDACRELGARYVRRGPGNCYGDAVRTGIREARGRYLLFMDADGSHAPELIPQLLEQAPQNGVVIASRYVKGGATENKPLLKLMSIVLNFSYAVILGLKVKDVSNSFKVYRAELVKPMRLVCNNFDIIEEILYKIVRANPGLAIREIPCTFKKRMFGETKRNLLLFIATYIVTMLKLRFFT